MHRRSVCIGGRRMFTRNSVKRVPIVDITLHDKAGEKIRNRRERREILRVDPNNPETWENPRGNGGYRRIKNKSVYTRIREFYSGKNSYIKSNYEYLRELHPEFSSEEINKILKEDYRKAIMK